ncbi:MAG: FAD-binding protein [Parachlamydiaceae bacterium]|nr:FAD-binding protein [Parachlamydiaceae bacterium]
MAKTDLAALELFQNEFSNTLNGEVRFDEITRIAYSVDASIYEIQPIGVVTPTNRTQLISTLEIAGRHGISVIARGAATGITGGCIGPGLVIDVSKYLKAIIEINYGEEFVICEPGVIQDELNAQLSSHGYRLGPDTSTGNRATIGGMLANNAAGARSLHYGKMVDHVEEVLLALTNGELIRLKELSSEELQEKISQEGHESEIYKKVLGLREEYKDDILLHFPKIPRRVSGYNLDELIKNENLNLSKLIAGSEGTLGIVIEMKLKISKKPRALGLCIIHCHEMLPSMKYVPEMLRFHSFSLEMIDAHILTAGRNHPATQGKLKWLVGEPNVVFVAEFEEANEALVQEKLALFTTEMQKLNVGYAYVHVTNPPEMDAVWAVRKAGLGLLLSKRTYSRAIAFIEDISVGPDSLAPFMEAFLACLKRFGKEAGIYGHVGAGCIHIRPYVDLNQADEQKTMEKMMLAVAELLLEHGGALSGEHGDGYVRSWLNEKMFGERLHRAFCELKAAFDPNNLMNPGKIVHGAPLLHDLRSSTKAEVSKIETFLDFSKEGGFELAVDLCNGNGLCRKSEGVMCPSFQVTRDEYDTTRARAQALRAITHGTLPKESLSSQELYDVLDLCLQCKGCKTECPSQVDMAKMKSEFLYHYHKKHGYSFRTRLFGEIGTINKLTSPFASLFNAVSETFIVKKLLSWIGIAPERTLPKLSNERFSKWVKRQSQSKGTIPKKRVVLFNDTFTEFNHPEIGKAAYKVLMSLGYEVIVPAWNCCGRTLYSKGMLSEAKKRADALVVILFRYAEEGIPIVGLEPSCLFMMKDEFQGFVKQDEQLKKVQSSCITFDDFIYQHIVEGVLPLPLTFQEVDFKFHGHCHHKSSGGIKTSMDVLNSLPGAQAIAIDAGCCGMAGSFGYEKEHYVISMAIGSLKLFPAINKPSERIFQVVANGISCRQQIADGTGRQALHLAEVIAQRLITEV